MDETRIWSADEEAIIATNTDATECKRSAVELGYWRDDYIIYFAKHVDRKAPEINRGYYTRVKTIEMIIYKFVEKCEGKCQIINLGCGFDTLYWRLTDTIASIERFIELDFASVVAKKWHIIKRNKKLSDKIVGQDSDSDAELGAGVVGGGSYRLVPCDLRVARDVERALAAADLQPHRPTLVLAECVLVYMEEAAARALLERLSGSLPAALLVLYEQCRLRDRFGAVMLRALAARGCGVCESRAALDPPAQADWTRRAGWDRAAAVSLDACWRALADTERARVEALEPLDERELLAQLHAHYSLLLATRGPDLAPLLALLPTDPSDSNRPPADM